MYQKRPMPTHTEAIQFVIDALDKCRIQVLSQSLDEDRMQSDIVLFTAEKSLLLL